MNTIRNAPTARIKDRTQRGEAEMMFFGVILIVCGIISGTLLILNWVKDTKNARVDDARAAHFARGTPTPFSPRPDPAAYLAHCEKPGWAITQTEFPCEVLPESYGEIFLAPDAEE